MVTTETKGPDGEPIIIEVGDNDWDGMLALGEAFLHSVHLSRGLNDTDAIDDDIDKALWAYRRMHGEIDRLNVKLDEVIDDNFEMAEVNLGLREDCEKLYMMNIKLVEIARKAVRGELDIEGEIAQAQGGAKDGDEEIDHPRGAGGDVRQARRGPHQQPGHHNERIRRCRGPYGQARRERRHHPEQCREGL